MGNYTLRGERSLAKRLIKRARANGCKRIEVWAEGELLAHENVEGEIVRAIVDLCDDVCIIFFGDDDEHLSNVLWINGNGNDGRDAISDYALTSWAELVLDTLIQELIDEEALEG